MKKYIRRISLLAFLLVIFLSNSSFAKADEDIEKANIYIDTPDYEVLGNNIYISGWVMATVENDTKIYMDNSEIPNVQRIERNDVLSAVKEYGNKDTNSTPGYNVSYTPTNLSDGVHKITIKVFNKNKGNEISSCVKYIKYTRYKATQYIDSPQYDVFGKQITVNGWAMGSTKNNVKVYVDGDEAKNVTRVERSDVLKNVKGYGESSDNPKPGYSATYDASALNDGTHKITVQVVDEENGKVMSTESRTIRLTKYKATQYIDSPKSDVLGKKITINGWAMGSTKNNIKIYVDGNEVNDVIRTERSDVLRLVTEYGSAKDNPKPGYSATYDASALNDGTHKITVQVVDEENGKVMSTESMSINLEKYKVTQYIESPTSTIKGNIININGWAMSSDPYAIIKIYIDGNEVNNVIRTERNDVLNIVKGYGDKTTNPKPGYKATYDASALKDGSHMVKIDIIDTKTKSTLSTMQQKFSLNKYKTTQCIDKPSGEINGTSLEFKGWTMTTDPNAVVEAYVNGVKIESINRTERNDVLNIVKGYGDKTTNPKPGYNGTLDVGSFKDGTYKFEIKVVDSLTKEVLNSSSTIFNLKKYKGTIYIESPVSSMFSKSITFNGWEMSESADSYINVYVDGNKANVTTTRSARPDVIKNVTNYGTAENNKEPGFQISLDLNKYGNGRHTISLKLYSKFGDLLEAVDKEIYAYNNVSMGIDVSQFNSDINWRDVRANGATFAMIRIGVRGYGDAGNIKLDSRFNDNIKNANNAGIKTGIYFFSQARNYDEGVAEARFVIDYLNSKNLSKKIQLPIAFDTEKSTCNEYPNCGRADLISNNDRTLATLGFVQTIANAGYKPMIYASKSWFGDKLNMLMLNQYDVWLAHYTSGGLSTPSDYNGPYKMWQYTSKGSIGGVSGNVDRDVLYD